MTRTLGIASWIAAALLWAGCDKTPSPRRGGPAPASKTDARPRQAPKQRASAERPERSTAELLANLGADDPGAADQAILELVKRGRRDPKVVKALARVLLGDDPLCAQDAAEALVRIGDTSVLPDVIAALRRPETREAARPVLKAVATRQAIPRLAPLVTDKDWYVRSAAIDTLAALGGPAALEALLPGLKAKDYRTRREIAAALGDIGGPRAAAALVQLLTDDSPRVTDEAARALRRLAGKSFGFRPFDPPDDRAKAIERWKQWAKAQSK